VWPRRPSAGTAPSPLDGSSVGFALSIATPEVPAVSAAIFVARALRRAPALELFEVAARLRRRAVEVRRALRASPAHASRRRRRAVAVHGAPCTAARDEITDRLARSAVAVLVALDARAGRRVAELGPFVPALRVVRALRMAFVIARPTRRLRGPAVAVVPALFAPAGQTERIASPAIGVAEALHAAEGRVAFTSAARPLRAGEVAPDDRRGVSVASAGEHDERSDRQRDDPIHDSYGSLRPR
jgi:hypothetical protein